MCWCLRVYEERNKKDEFIWIIPFVKKESNFWTTKRKVAMKRLSAPMMDCELERKSLLLTSKKNPLSYHRFRWPQLPDNILLRSSSSQIIHFIDEEHTTQKLIWVKIFNKLRGKLQQTHRNTFLFIEDFHPVHQNLSFQISKFTTPNHHYDLYRR